MGVKWDMMLGLEGMETMMLNSALLTEIVVLGKELGVNEYAGILEKKVFHLSILPLRTHDPIVL